MGLVLRLFIACMLLFPIGLTFPPVFADTIIPYKFTDGFELGYPWVGGIGVTQWRSNIVFIQYASGKMIFSRYPDGTGSPLIGDSVIVLNFPPHGGLPYQIFRTTYNCIFFTPLLPQDVTRLFSPGFNQSYIRIIDWCGRPKTISSLYLVNIIPSPTPLPTPTPDPGPEPFLDLPWDYGGKGLSFTEAAQAINSFFDHEYPLLSSGLGEPSLVVTFEDPSRRDESYSSHDGYDYGRPAKAYIGDPMLAAASGKAKYINSCGACGNMIMIDHQNGYQTRYMHLQKDGLITDIPGQEVEVSAGQLIGKIGATGNVSPPGEAGAHIHFMVVEDKNGDGNFDDNIPDGVTDPFGWQSDQPDPWELYSFFYNGQNRAGNKSRYLWKKKLDGKDTVIASDGGTVSVGKFAFDFPSGFTDQALTFSFQSAPLAYASASLRSLGSTILVTAKDTLGNAVENFNSPFEITVDFSAIDLSGIKLDTLSLYSSIDGATWVKENTIIDQQSATAEVDHLTRFALMGERSDMIAPITEAELAGLKGQDNWFRSDVELSLSASDNEAGLGVDYTLYKKEDGDWETYTEPLTFSQEGHYKVEFYSADRDENLETVKSVEFDIDKTEPHVSIEATPDVLWPPNGKMVDVVVSGSSSDEHLFKTSFSVGDEYDAIEPAISDFGRTIQLEAGRKGSDKDERTYIIKAVAEDLAGNTKEDTTEVLVPHDQGQEEKK